MSKATGHSCTNCGKYILSQNGSHEYFSMNKEYKMIVTYFCNKSCFNSFAKLRKIGAHILFRFGGDTIYEGFI